MLKITAKKDGFWRCGVRHSIEPRTYPDGHFPATQLAILKAEPMLVVQELPDEEKNDKKK